MSLAEQMLATMPLSDDSVTYLADEEPHIVINESRQAIVPNELKTIAVTGDKDIETVTFDCVRHWDGNDLSTFSIYLNYVLPDLTPGTYIPDVISTSDGDNFYHFDWKIKNTLTKKSGKISFAITAIKTKQNENGETVVDKQWGSLPNGDCSIALGLGISNVPDEEESSDVVAQLSAILEKIQGDLDEWVKNNVVQSTGSSTTKVMSQKATSEIAYGSMLGVVEVKPSYEFGTIADNSNQLVANDYRVRTVDYIVTNGRKVNFSVPSNVIVWIKEFDENYNFVKDVGRYESGEFTYRTTEKYIKFICANNEYGIITIADCIPIKVSVQLPYGDDRNTINVLMERGGLTRGKLDYGLDNYKLMVRTAYFIKTNGATTFTFNNLDFSQLRVGDTQGILEVGFFDGDFNYLGYWSIDQTHNGRIPLSQPIIEGCEYIKFCMTMPNHNVESLSLTFVGGVEPPVELVGKNMQFREVSEKINFKVTDDVFTTSRLILPPNYNINGEKTPLILWLDGSGNFTTWGEELSSTKLPYLQYLCDEGFAVLSVFGWGSKYFERYPTVGMAHPYPTPINLECLKKGIEYVCERYNIDANNIHIMSKSQGGQVALYLASRPLFNIRSIGMFAPVLDYLSMPGEALYADTRKAIAEDLNFSGDTDYFGSTSFLSYSENGRAFLRENMIKLCSLNEAWTDLVGGTLEERFNDAMDDCEAYWQNKTSTDIYQHYEYTKLAKIPVKVWGSADDDQTPYMKMVEVVKQLQNGGTEAHLVTLPNGTGGHSSADVGANRIASVTTALGIVHTDVPVGWVQNVEWIRSKIP